MTFDRTSTTEDVLSGVDLTGKTVIITGASTGLGAETARAMAIHGADLTLVARSSEKLNRVAEEIHTATGRTPETATLELDKPSTVRSFAETWLASHDTLDLLINNAGIMAPPLTRTAEGWESQFATNHLGHFLLTNLLGPALQGAGSARVINLSSAGHWFSPVDLDDPNYERRPYDPMAAYGQSKTANIWFSLELSRRWAEHGVSSFAVHPGGIETELDRNLDPSILGAIEKMFEDYGHLFKTIPQGAATTCWAATSASLNGKSGLYLEDCQISKPAESDDFGQGGYLPHAYDEKGAAGLWELSNQLLGTSF
ncbi:MAG: SDR family NAD(P)-dependent oxidoreductase [Acidobacteriota bacterium]